MDLGWGFYGLSVSLTYLRDLRTALYKHQDLGCPQHTRLDGHEEIRSGPVVSWMPGSVHTAMLIFLAALTSKLPSSISGSMTSHPKSYTYLACPSDIC